VPRDVIKAKCAPFLRRGKPTHLLHLASCTPFDIVRIYGAQYRGIVQYYLLAGDVWKLDRLKGVMLTSLLKTLAARHRSTVTAMANKYKTVVRTPEGSRRCFEARVEREGRKPLTARFGGIPLIRQRKAVLNDLPPTLLMPRSRPRGSQLIDRLRHGRCELCDEWTDVQVHQVRHLAEIQAAKEQTAWMQLMLRKRRRTLVVCPSCHGGIHA
ncbi:group II intron reverse transcriptase/maturase, partial [Streptomyces sp. NPDC050617]|uniref:HNH endonuclease n=1 Tax=Streptomyces sp. NPDC050617 TaxID=3154628 RepID=UPI003438562E